MPATLYLGRTGSGKTTLMREHVKQIMAGNAEAVILGVDHGEVAGKPSWRDVPGIRFYHTVPAWWRDPHRFAFFRGVPGREVADLAVKVGWSTYVDDECDDVTSDGWSDSPLREIVKRGRHLVNLSGDQDNATNVHALLGTHRPANFPTDCRGAGFDRIYIGRLESYSDCKRIKDEGWIPGTEVRTVEDVQRILRPLAPDDPNAPGERRFISYP